MTRGTLVSSSPLITEPFGQPVQKLIQQSLTDKYQGQTIVKMNKVV